MPMGNILEPSTFDKVLYQTSMFQKTAANFYPSHENTCEFPDDNA